MKRILVVDDDADIRDSVADVLTGEGYEVLQAGNGKQALEVLKGMSTEPCLVLLDMLMPEMTGLEFVRLLHDAHRLATLPVVLMTSTDGRDAPPGVRKRMKKPVSLEALIALVRDFCGDSAGECT